MGFMIQILFEPSMLGVDHVLCTRCGRLLLPEDHVPGPEGDGAYVVWRTDSNPSGGRNADGTDKECSPHAITCPCGEDTIIGEAIYDGFMIRLKQEPILYPRRTNDDGELKDLPSVVWKECDPYLTKKGKICYAKATNLFSGEVARQNEVYDVLQTRLGITFQGDDLDMNLSSLLDVYPGVKITKRIYDLSAKDGLIIIKERRHWTGEKKLGWRLNYDWITAGGQIIGYDKNWVNLQETEEWFNANGLSMNRGKFAIDDDIESDTYQCAYWYDPSAKKYVIVADTIDGWSYCRYDEDQGADDDEDDLDGYLASEAEGYVEPEDSVEEDDTEEEELADEE